MKKLVLFFLLLCLLLTACGSEAGEPEIEMDTADEDTALLPSEPAADKSSEAQTDEEESEYKIAVSAVNSVGAACISLDMGSAITVNGKEGYFYSVSYKGNSYYAAAKDIRFEGEDFPARGIVSVKNAEMYSFILTAGQELYVISESDNLCLVSNGLLSGKVPRRALLMDGDSAYESWSGLSAEGAWFYRSWQMTDAPERIKEGQFVTVLLETEDGLYVKLGDEYGFMFVSDIQRTDEQTEAGENYAEWTSPKL